MLFRSQSRSDVIIATSPEAVRGLQVTSGVFLPNWQEGTKDPKGFLQLLFYASEGKNPTIRKMLQDYVDKEVYRLRKEVMGTTRCENLSLYLCCVPGSERTR